jgi:uncharacterized protein (TIGR02679 family)
VSERRRLDPALDRVLRAGREKRERRGGTGDATVNVAALHDAEAFALDGLLAAVSPRKQTVLAGGSLHVKLSELEAALRAAGFDPRAEYERVGEAPLRDLRAERAGARHARESFREWLWSHEVVRTRPALVEWTHRALEQGRLHQAMRPVVDQALRTIEALPSPEPVQRTVLAARLLDGDPHALDPGTPLHGLVVSLLVAQAGLDATVGTREVWQRFGVIVDPVSSNVIALGLPLAGDGVAARLVGAAAGTHVILTHAQLSAGRVAWPAGVPCFSCENPSVLIAAEQALGGSCAPLICTGGHPSEAARLLLSAIAQAGGEVRHHGDFDEAGLTIFYDLQERYGAVPWRFDRDALHHTIARIGLVPDSTTARSLGELVASLPRALPEELVLEELLNDLREAAAHAS